jgi:hypothetical protein
LHHRLDHLGVATWKDNRVLVNVLGEIEAGVIDPKRIA